MLLVLDPWTIYIFFTSATAVFVGAVIAFNLIRSWFEKKRQLVESDKHNLGFTLKEKITNNDYVVYQGIFNRKEDKIFDGQKIQGKSLDGELEEVHQGKDLVIYE